MISHKQQNMIFEYQIYKYCSQLLTYGNIKYFPLQLHFHLYGCGLFG